MRNSIEEYKSINPADFNDYLDVLVLMRSRYSN